MSAPPAEPAYWLDNYGTCARGPDCQCGRYGNPWLGQSCQSWRPSGARSFEELLALATKKIA